MIRPLFFSSETSPGIKNYSDNDASERRRTLKSSSTTVQQPTASSTSSKSTSTVTAPPFKIDSDSDGDGDLMQSYLDQHCTPTKSSLAKKTLKSSARSGKISDFVETREIRGASLKGKSLLTKPTSSEGGVHSNSSRNNDPKEARKKATNVDVRDSEMLFDGSVNLDLDSVEIQSVAMGSSPPKGEKEKEIVANSAKTKGEAKGESPASKIDVLPDGREVENDVCLMETELENEGDVLRPPRHRSISRPFIEDDSTDDENECVRPATSEEEGTKTAATKNRKQKENVEEHLVSPQSESEAMLSRSILEKMGKEVEDDELKPSQALCNPDVTSSKLDKEPEAVGEFENTGSSLTAASSFVKQTEDRFVEEDHLEVTESQRTREKRSEAAERAAVAAENRLKTKTRRGLLEACSSRYTSEKRYWSCMT